MGNTRLAAERLGSAAPNGEVPDNTSVPCYPRRATQGNTRCVRKAQGRQGAFSRAVTHVAHVASQIDRREAAARAHALLAEAFERIAGSWVEGAELAGELEADIDRAVLAADLGALRAALSVYEQAAGERCAVARENTTGEGGHGEATPEG